MFPVADTSLEASKARNKGIEIHVIAVGSNKDMTEINGIASKPTAEHILGVNILNYT